MSDTTKTDLLHSIVAIIDEADARLSWDQLPNRSRLQTAKKYTNTLLALEKPPPEVRYAHVIDSMYDLDDECEPINQECIFVTFPKEGSNEDLDGDFHEMHRVGTPGLYIRRVVHKDQLYPCTRQAPNKLQFKLVYDGTWNGNGEVFETDPMISLTKPDLLKLADEAMVHTGNEHHCHLECLRYDQIDNDGVVHLRLIFGS